MKLYHIDRSGHIKSGETISLIKNFPTKKMKDKEYYKDGLSSMVFVIIPMTQEIIIS